MVEYTEKLDTVFDSLGDTTRRDILRRVAWRELTISQVARSYDMSFSAVAKHVEVLERAGLITKRREGKHQLVRTEPKALKSAARYLEHYEKMWHGRLDRLDNYLKNQGRKHGKR